MTEPIRSRRVSMAYILGFSNKPFKEDKPLLPPPPPSPQLPRRSPFTEAGGLFEWTASDGRRGKLTGRGKPRLTAANVAMVPSAKQPNKPTPKNSMTKKAIAEAVVHAVEDTGGLMGLFDDTPTAKEEKKPETSATFTGEQDKTLMEMKDSNKTWAEIATKLDKDADECKARFKLIKPADWKPTEKGGNQKKEQNKKGDKGKDQGKKSQKESEKKEESTNTKGNGNNESTDNNGTTGNGGSNNMGGHNMWGSWETAPENAGENADTGKGEESWGKDQWGDADGGEQTWKGDGGGDDAWATVDGAADSGNTGSGAKEGANAWDTTETWGQTPTGGDSSSKPGSKAPSKSGSKAPSKKSTTKPQPAVASTPTPTTEPLMYEITPDDTFSADDLRAIARILQQDAKMVWNRVSWRFRDKTGRNVDPDVFEEKITGRIEGKGREERSQSGG